MAKRHDPQPIFEVQVRQERVLTGWRQKCEECHVQFTSKRPDKHTCSQACQKARQRRLASREPAE